jgi:hypothetical protein
MLYRDSNSHFYNEHSYWFLHFSGLEAVKETFTAKKKISFTCIGFLNFNNKNYVGNDSEKLMGENVKVNLRESHYNVN